MADPIPDSEAATCDKSASSASLVGPSHVGSLSLCSATSNMVLSVLGAGQLTLPYALSQLGLAFGLLSLVTFAGLSVHSLHTLSIYQLHFTPDQSYSDLVVRVLGWLGSWVCSSLLALYAWGGALSFMVILKGELAAVAAFATGHSPSGGVLLAVLSVAFLWPLSSLKDLSSFKRFSPLGCLAAVFITFVVLLCTRWTGEAPMGTDACAGPRGSEMPQLVNGLRYWPESLLSVAASLPLLSFALNSSWAYIPILCTLRNKSKKRVCGLILSGNVVILTNYLLISTFGYTMFCDGTAPNILDSLGSAAGAGPVRLLIMSARLALSVQLALALPMRFFIAGRTIGGDSNSPAVRIGLAGLLVGSALALAVTPLSLATAMGITSSICASMIIYILPAIVDLRIGLKGTARRLLSLLSLLVGIFIFAGGLTANLLGVAVGG